MNNYNHFSENHKLFFVKFMEWYWKSMQNMNPDFLIEFRTNVTIMDYEFIYSLWRNGVDSDRCENVRSEGGTCSSNDCKYPECVKDGTNP